MIRTTCADYRVNRLKRNHTAGLPVNQIRTNAYLTRHGKAENRQVRKRNRLAQERKRDMNTELEENVKKLFDRYEHFFRQSLGGDINADEMAALYTSDFIAATPAGVMTGKNDNEFRQVMTQGYAHYRGIGMFVLRPCRYLRMYRLMVNIAPRWNMVFAPCSSLSFRSVFSIELSLFGSIPRSFNIAAISGWVLPSSRYWIISSSMG